MLGMAVAAAVAGGAGCGDPTGPGLDAESGTYSFVSTNGAGEALLEGVLVLRFYRFAIVSGDWEVERVVSGADVDGSTRLAGAGVVTGNGEPGGREPIALILVGGDGFNRFLDGNWGTHYEGFSGTWQVPGFEGQPSATGRFTAVRIGDRITPPDR
jgi:hypothetical protein